MRDEYLESLHFEYEIFWIGHAQTLSVDIAPYHAYRRAYLLDGIRTGEVTYVTGMPYLIAVAYMLDDIIAEIAMSV